jgi:hypothetical protein
MNKALISEVQNEIVNRRLDVYHIEEEIKKVDALLIDDNISVIIRNNKFGMEHVEVTHGVFSKTVIQRYLNNRLLQLKLHRTINNAAIDMAENRLVWLNNPDNVRS